MKSSFPALLVHETQRGRLDLQQTRQLRRSAAKQACGRSWFEPVGRENIKRLGEERGEIVVIGPDRDPAVTATRLPERGGGTARHQREPKLQGQVEAEPEECHAQVFGLAAPFARL